MNYCYLENKFSIKIRVYITLILVLFFTFNKADANDVKSVLDELRLIQTKILNCNKSKISVSWRYQLINPAYTDTTIELFDFSYDPAHRKTYLKYQYLDFDTIYTSILFATGNDYRYKEDEEFRFSCYKTTTIEKVKKYWIPSIPYYMHPLANRFSFDTVEFKIEIEHKENGDTVKFTAKNNELVRLFFINSLGYIMYYEETFYFSMAKSEFSQKIIYDQMKYSNTSFNISPYYKLRKCPPITPQKIEKPLAADSFFFNKKFNYHPLLKYIDSNNFQSHSKILLIDYSFLSCFGCVLLLKSYEKLLDSFNNEIDILLIDPVDERGREFAVKLQLEKYKIKNRVKHYLVKDAAWEITYHRIINTYPTLLLIDKNGIVRYVKIGVNIDEDVFETLKNEILKLKE